MSLRDRDYIPEGSAEPGERPPKPRWGIVIIALVMVAIFLLFILLPLIR